MDGSYEVSSKDTGREYIERQLRDDGFTEYGAAWTARALDYSTFWD
jgi:hypothetical protein